MDNPTAGDTDRAGPHWLQPEIQQRIKWRDGDVVISVPPKSGTTWTMNIVYQLLAGGTARFRDIYEQVPWIELLSHPEQPYQEVLDRLEALPVGRRRAFKTHSAPPALPFLKGDSGQDVKYIVVFRNPEEALVSFRPFIGQHTDEWFHLWQVSRDAMCTDEWFHLWQVSREAMCRPDFLSFYWDVIDNNGMQRRFFGFLAAWWPLQLMR